MYSGVGTTQVCREGQCHACDGYQYTQSADFPWRCEHWCHDERPACLDDIDDFSPEAELRGDAIRHENRES